MWSLAHIIEQTSWKQRQAMMYYPVLIQLGQALGDIAGITGWRDGAGRGVASLQIPLFPV